VLDGAARAQLNEDLRRLADGDRTAFDAVFARLWPVLRAFAARHLSGADAEDAAQRALLKVFERAGTFDRERDALAWALGMAVWEIRTVRRQQTRRRITDLSDDPATFRSRLPDPEELAIAADLARAVQRTVAGLAPADAEALLSDAAGERAAGVAFRKRLQRARERLRMLWRRDHD
jgi:RNA polymerase sigma factor (sigma-70 family)